MPSEHVTCYLASGTPSCAAQDGWQPSHPRTVLTPAPGQTGGSGGASQVGSLSREGMCSPWLWLPGRVSPGQELASWQGFSKVFTRQRQPCMPHLGLCTQEGLGHVSGARVGNTTPIPPRVASAHPWAALLPALTRGGWGSEQRWPGHAQGGTQPALGRHLQAGLQPEALSPDFEATSLPGLPCSWRLAGS